MGVYWNNRLRAGLAMPAICAAQSWVVLDVAIVATPCRPFVGRWGSATLICNGCSRRTRWCSAACSSWGPSCRPGGRRCAFLIGLALFTAASAWLHVGVVASALIAARVAQALVPLALACRTRTADNTGCARRGPARRIG